MLRRRLLLGLALLVLTALPSALSAQNVITLRADSARRTIAPSSKLAVPIIVDMSAAAGTNLASLQAGVTFGANRLTFDSVKSVGFGSLTPNATSAASGALTLVVFDASGTTTTQTLAMMYFTSSTTTGGTTIAFSPTVAGSDQAANILSLMRTVALDVCVAPSGKWGDVNGDSVATPMGDGTVNIIDAQQIARYSVALSVSNRPGIIARGDVTNDGNVNIIDAQQIARFSVGLNVSVRVNAALFVPPAIASVSVSQSSATLAAGQGLQLSASPLDVSNTAQNGCVPVAWTSSDDAVAMVDSTGYVRAVSSGSATITASAGGMTTTSVITVASSTGVRLAVTSPVAASRWYVVADSGTLESPQVSKFIGNNRRVDTLLVSLPAGSGYRLRLLVVDSASTLPDSAPLVTAGGRISGVSVAAGSLTPKLVEATALSAVVAMPATVAVGGSVPIDLTLTDPSQVLSATGECAIFYSGITSWAKDGFAIGTWLCSRTTPTSTTVRYTGSALAPLATDTLYSQLRVMTFVAGRWFYFYVPSRQLGQPLRTTVVVSATTGVRLAVISPKAASRWYVVADSGTLTSPQVTKFAGNNRRVDTLLVSLPAGSGYRLRLLVADSASADPDVSPLVTAGGRISGVSVEAGSMTPRSVAATALAAVVTMPDTVAVGGGVPVELTLTDPSQVLSAATENYFKYATASWTTDFSGSAIVNPSGYLAGPTAWTATTVTYNWWAIAPSSVGTFYSQIQMSNRIAGQQFHFFVPSLQLGQPLRSTSVVTPTTGVRLALTAPRAASRWYVVADSGTLAAPQVSRFPGNNRRADTLLVSLPAGSGYRLRLLVADSVSTNPDGEPLVTAGGRISGVSVVAGSLTPRSVAATALSAVVTMPDTVAVGGSVPIGLTLTDPSQGFSASPYCAQFLFGAASWEGDGSRPWASLCTAALLSPTTISYTGSAIAPATAGTMFSQLRVVNVIAGKNFHFYVPSQQLGQPLRTTAVVVPTTGVRLAVTSPRAASRWYVVADSGTLTSPQVSKFLGGDRRVDTLLVPLPAGSGYRLRLVVADSASTSPDDFPLATAGGRISGVSVVAGSLSAQSIAATALSAVVSMPDTVAVGGSASIDLTLTDPSQVLSANLGYCASFYSGSASWATDPVGLPYTPLCTWTTPTSTTIRYTGSMIAPSSAGTMLSQLRAVAVVGGQGFNFYTPSLQLGQALRTTTIRDVIVTSITVAPVSPNLDVGQTMQLTATAADAGNNVIAGTTFTWSSSNQLVARVDANGNVQALGAGTTNIAATAGGVTGFATLTVTSAPQQYNIIVRIIGTMTPSQQAAFSAAATRWTQVVRGDVPDVILSDISLTPCGVPGVTLNETVDDLVIYAKIDSIDGPGAVLASAGPCYVRSGSGLPIVGVMHFDIADLAGMEANGTFEAIVLHEMGHVLGFGTMWSSRGLIGASGTSDPFFNGVVANHAFPAIGFGSYVGNRVPIENQGGAGTVEGHWRETVLDRELMTGYVEAGGIAMPLSALTIGSLIDLGYVADFSAADSGPFALRALRADDVSSRIKLVEGAPPIPIVIDAQGRTVRP